VKKIFFICLTLIIGINVNAQLSNKHWIPPLHANEDTTDNTNPPQSLVLDHYIYLSTPEPTPFQVTIKRGDGQNFVQPVTISQGNPIRVNIGSSQPSTIMLERNDVGHVVSGKGLILEGQYDFYVSFRVRAANHSEFLASKGKIGAGTVFRLGSLPQTDYGTIRNFVSSFMATEDNTTVELSNYNPNIKFINGNGTFSSPTQTFILNKGQSVVVSGNTQNNSANLEGFVGALLTSDKPIVVNTGNLAGGMDSSSNGQDFNLDQIVPWDQVGDEYIIMRGNGSNLSEKPLVIAHEDNTEIYLNGSPTPIATLNAGQYFLVSPNNFMGTGINKNMYLKGNKSFYLYQIVAGNTFNATSGFFFIPPLNCYWQKSVDLIPSINRIGSTSYSADLILATEANATVTINGVATTATPLPVTGNPNWESYRISGLTGNVAVESTGPLAVGVFGFDGNASGYGGYFSGFGAQPKDITLDVCTGAIVNLFEKIPGNPEIGGTWYFQDINNPPRAQGGMFNPNTDVLGDYIYHFTKQCPGQAPLPVYITVTVNAIQPGPNVGTSSSKSYCVTDSVEDLTNVLGTNITPNGSWTFNDNPRPNGIIDPSVDQSGVYKYTIAPQGVCDAVSASVTVTINPSPLLVNVPNFELCDDTLSGSDTDGLSVFNLNTKSSEVFGSQTGVSVKYYENPIDAENEAPNNITSITATTGKTIYFRIENNLGCFQVGNFNLIVNPKPIVSDIVTLKQCDDDNDTQATFVLTQANGLISSDSNITFTYHTSQSGANNNTALITNDNAYLASNGSSVWARIENTFGCYRIARVNLVVSTTQFPTTFVAQPYFECDDYINATDIDNDGFDYFDIDTFFTNNIINAFPVSQQPFLGVTYYENYNDAELVINPITDINNYRNIVAGGNSIWARVDSQLNNDPGCKGIQELQLIVNPIPEVNLGVNFTLCVDPINGTGSQVVDATPSNSGTFSYVWSTDISGLDLSSETNAQYTISQEGTYHVLVTNTNTGCENTDSITATYSSEPATFEASVTTEPFEAGLSTIVGIASGGFGTYEYSLDLINWQLSPQFNNIPNGNHTIYVRDIQGCGILSVTNLIAITYPNFFTPNGDGYNDTWNISNLPQDYNAKLYIFDRYGKLIKQISPNGNGWNGTYNGEILPSSDYWFTLEYTINNEQKEFKSHFSLKR